MLREILIVLGTIAIPLLMNLGIFRTMYGKQRPTKILGKMVPSIIVVAISFFILGKTGTARIDIVLLVFAITALTVFFNFIIVGSRLLKPLNAIAYGLIAGGSHMADASSEVFSVSQSLAEGASQQAAGLEESSSSLEEMASMAKQIAENAHAGKAITEEAKRVIEEVQDRMGALTSAMEDITRSSQETGKIVKTIDSIAFQTNLLALNASVEAARAGAAGAGFSVVAEEVRKLALNAAEAAKNSSKLIEKTMDSVNIGNRLKAETEAAFGRNMEMSAQIGKLIDDIAEASKQESDGIAQVNTAVAEMDKVVQQGVASTGALASAAEDTSKQAEKMKDFVTALADLFGVGENGTPKDAKKILKKLTSYLKTKGKQRTLAEVSNLKGKFVDRDIYSFVYDMDAVVIAHGADHSLIGRDLLDVQDAEGRYFQREIMQAARAHGGGEINYRWTNPVTKRVQGKIVYFKKVDDLIIATGAYCN